MVQPIYELTSGITVKMCPSHQAGEERGRLGGASGIILRAMSAHNRAGN